jgi:hypothetical protein
MAVFTGNSGSVSGIPGTGIVVRWELDVSGEFIESTPYGEHGYKAFDQAFAVTTGTLDMIMDSAGWPSFPWFNETAFVATLKPITGRQFIIGGKISNTSVFVTGNGDQGARVIFLGWGKPYPLL